MAGAAQKTFGERLDPRKSVAARMTWASVLAVLLLAGQYYLTQYARQAEGLPEARLPPSAVKAGEGAADAGLLEKKDGKFLEAGLQKRSSVEMSFPLAQLDRRLAPKSILVRISWEYKGGGRQLPRAGLHALANGFWREACANAEVPAEPATVECDVTAFGWQGSEANYSLSFSGGNTGVVEIDYAALVLVGGKKRADKPASQLPAPFTMVGAEDAVRN